MKKIDKHIQIVVSSRNASLVSLSQTNQEGVGVVLAKHYTKVGVTIVDCLADLEALVLLKPDLVFLRAKLVRKGKQTSQTELTWISEFLDEHGIAYTGSAQKANELELNKQLAKQRMLSAGLKTAKFFVYDKDQPKINDGKQLDYPLFIKPTSRANGLGIDNRSIAYNFEQLSSKVGSIAQELDSNSLVEEYLPGREFSVAILRDSKSSKLLAMPIELFGPSANLDESILSSKVKLSNTERFEKVASGTIRAGVVSLATKAFEALGARDYGRIDIRLDKNGAPNFIEANLSPSLTEGYGSFPKACALNLGWSYETMILAIANLALTRTENLTNKSKIDLNIPVRPLAVLPA